MSQVLELLKKSGAIITNSHFVGTSGAHFDTYIKKDALYPHTEDTSAVCKLFAEKVKDFDIEVVVGPALGGIILSTWTAHHLTQIRGKEILSVYCEKAQGGGMAAETDMVLTRGYDSYVKGKKVLVVEDLTTTGISAKKVVDTVKNAGGEVVAVMVMVNRSPKAVTGEYFGVPFLPLDELEITNYNEIDCPLCAAGVPINTKVGHGKKYLEEKSNV
jgi:orotate phosphoribosyltransferase